MGLARPRRAHPPGRAQRRRLDRPRARSLTAPASAAAAARALAHAQHARAGRRRDIAAHYDLGNELFARMLDRTMIYSCALFERRRMTLEEAPGRQARAGLRQARPRPERPPARDRHRVGWPRRPRRRDARLPGHDDHDLARAARPRDRRACAGPACRIGSRSCCQRLPRPARPLRQARLDRDDRGRRLAAHRRVLRAVLGAARSPTGRCCSRRSRSTTAPTRSRRPPGRSSTTHIFPGGCLPSLEVIARNVARRTDLQAVGLEDLTPHYVETLRRWRAELRRERRRARRARIRRALPAAVDAVPLVLRGRLRRAAHLRHPAHARQAAPPVPPACVDLASGGFTEERTTGQEARTAWPSEASGRRMASG